MSAKPERKGAVAAAVILVSCMGYSGLFVMPMWVGSVGPLVKFSPFAMGLIASGELFAATAASFATSRIVSRGLIRLGCAGGLLTIGISNIASAEITDGMWLSVARIGAGVGEGAVLAFVNASIAGTSTPDRYFAWSQMGLGVFGLLLFASFPPVLDHFGVAGIFMTIGGTAFLVLPLCFRMPVKQKWVKEPTELSTVSPVLWRSIAGLGVIFVGCQGMWAFLVRAGEAKGLQTEYVARVLILGQVLGLFGPLVAQAIGKRLSWRSAVAFGLSVSSLAVISATQALPPSSFAVSAYAFQFGTLSIVTSYLSYLAMHDKTGKSAAAASSALNLGCAAGPAGVGMLWSLSGPVFAGWAVLTSYGLGYLLLLSERSTTRQGVSRYRL